MPPAISVPAVFFLVSQLQGAGLILKGDPMNYLTEIQLPIGD